MYIKVIARQSCCHVRDTVYIGNLSLLQLHILILHTETHKCDRLESCHMVHNKIHCSLHRAYLNDRSLTSNSRSQIRELHLACYISTSEKHLISYCHSRYRSILVQCLTTASELSIILLFSRRCVDILVRKQHSKQHVALFQPSSNSGNESRLQKNQCIFVMERACTAGQR